MQTISVTHFTRHLSEIINEVSSGNDFVIARHGKPVVVVTAWIEPKDDAPPQKRICRSPYGLNWADQKDKARERDEICQGCEMTPEENGRALDVHHRIPFRAFGWIPGRNENYIEANALENLVSLCKRCHKEAHRHRLTNLELLVRHAHQLGLPFLPSHHRISNQRPRLSPPIQPTA